MSNIHVSAIVNWKSFSYEDKDFSLDHLKAHKVTYKGNKEDYKFGVTYGLHCFAKDEQPFSIPLKYSDARESRQIDLERYYASRNLRNIIENLDQGKLMYETTSEKYFNIETINSHTGNLESYKVCFCFFKENRQLRMHVTSAFFDRNGRKPNNKSCSIFKIAVDTKARPRNKGIPKEANNKSGGL